MPPDTQEFGTPTREIKFLVSPVVAQRIREWARVRLAPDFNAGGKWGDEYQITSIYFDTDQYDVFHRRGSYGRGKYRIRRYGANETVFLERKLKRRERVRKRRSIVGLEETTRVNESQPDSRWSGFWYQRRLRARQLKPVCEISYRRTARVSQDESGPARLTLDENIRALDVHGPAFNGVLEDGVSVLQDRVILELKFPREAPAFFKQLIEAFALNPQPFSKYRHAAVALGLVPAEALDPYPSKIPEACLCQSS